MEIVGDIGGEVKKGQFMKIFECMLGRLSGVLGQQFLLMNFNYSSYFNGYSVVDIGNKVILFFYILVERFEVNN